MVFFGPPPQKKKKKFELRISNMDKNYIILMESGLNLRP